MNVPVTCRGGVSPSPHQCDWHRVEGRMQSAPTKLGCSLSEIALALVNLSEARNYIISNVRAAIAESGVRIV
jgi:hypothetical protein